MRRVGGNRTPGSYLGTDMDAGREEDFSPFDHIHQFETPVEFCTIGPKFNSANTCRVYRFGNIVCFYRATAITVGAPALVAGDVILTLPSKYIPPTTMLPMDLIALATTSTFQGPVAVILDSTGAITVSTVPAGGIVAGTTYHFECVRWVVDDV